MPSAGNLADVTVLLLGIGVPGSERATSGSG
jgi:hypothetical protein